MKEYLFSINDFKTQAIKENIDALAKLILNILFMKKGTYPTSPNMGVEIQKYKFEFIDDKLFDIQKEINDQIKMYIPELLLDEIIIKKIEDKTIVIGFVLTDYNNIKNKQGFLIKLNQDINNKIDSEILFV